MKGISATRFAPGSSLTRAQAVTILYRMEGEPETGTELSFVDVPKDQYYTQAVICAAEHQIVKGMDGTHYAPNGMITREQMVTMLARYAAYKGGRRPCKDGAGLPGCGTGQPLRRGSHGLGSGSRPDLRYGWHIKP